MFSVAPEAVVGGPLGLVRTGDRIRLSVRNKRIEPLIDDAELARRKARSDRTWAAGARLAALRYRFTPVADGLGPPPTPAYAGEALAEAARSLILANLSDRPSSLSSHSGFATWPSMVRK